MEYGLQVKSPVLLSLLPVRTCTRCGETKARDQFYWGGGHCKPCHLIRSREYRRAHPEALRASARKYLRKFRLSILARYGGTPPRCVCCGESEQNFLAVDHIDGGGARQRREGQGNLYWWLKRNGYPGGFQVLCHNCNLAKGFYKRCPHTEISIETAIGATC